MTPIRLRWVGAIRDSSGYASSSRNYVSALIDYQKQHPNELSLSVDTTVSFEQQKTQHEEFDKKAAPYCDQDVKPNIQVLHQTPENYTGRINKNTYNIAYTTWETDKLPPDWVGMINQVDEVWVPSTWNRALFLSSGITKPITVIPHIIPIPETITQQQVNIGVDDETFVFYTIGQWTERKGMIPLLKAYLTEFKPTDKVCLAIKSYRMNASVQEQNIIKAEIAHLKKSLQMTDFPEMRFFGSLLTPEQMVGFHKRGDCFVLPARAEGFGIPLAEAMAMGKPTIGTRYSGHLDFMNDDNSFLVDCWDTPVANMIFGPYRGWMNWAEPSVSHLKRLMRQVYEDREAAQKVAQRGQETVRKDLCAEVVVGKMIERLREAINSKQDQSR